MWAWIQEINSPSNYMVNKKAVSDNELSCVYCTCLLTSPEVAKGLLWSPYRPSKYWWETSRLPDISPAKISLSGISREWQFRVCNHGESRASPCMAREGEYLYIEIMKFRSAIVRKNPLLFIDCSCHKRRGAFRVPVGLCYHCRAWELLSLVSQFYLIDVSVC